MTLKRPSFLFSTNHQKKDNIPLRLPNLNINGFTFERGSSVKFLGVWIDENLTWRDQIHTFENKIAKNIGLLYQGKHNCLKQIYFAYIHVLIKLIKLN